MNIAQLQQEMEDTLGSELTLGVSTLTYPHDPVQATEEFLEAGLEPHRVEIALAKPLENPGKAIQELRALKNKHELAYSVHVPFFYDDLAHPEEAIRKVYVDFARDSIDMASELGARHVVVHPGGRYFDQVLPPEEALEPLKVPREEYVRNSLRSLNTLSEYAYSCGVELLIENLAGGLCDNPEEVDHLISPWPNASFLLDTGHGNVSGTLHELLELKPLYFHFHDNSGEEDDHGKLGEGNIDLARLLDQLRDYGGKKTIILELYSLEDVIGSLNTMEEALQEV
ncbi:sugar phosphate isomerase/epimerase [Candidatus Bipolaricaulota bacterium]|nr:sugar phosphate isomerase/epimerase [Candidatus Bipolaricaulota bacterium]